MSALKELDTFIKTQITTQFYGRGDSARQMRDCTYEQSEAYRQLVQEPGVADVLRVEGELAHWAAAKNQRRTSRDDNQFDFGGLPSAPVEFQELKRKNYIPASEEEAEEGEDGRHLEPENMTRQEMVDSGRFYQRSGRETMRRGEILITLAKYHEAMEIPVTMTIKQWRDEDYGRAA